MLNCIDCVLSGFQLSYMSVNTYLLIGIIIWLVKVFISSCIVKPSTTSHLEPHILFVLAVFFSPNIVFWPINIILDIYSLSALILKEYSTAQIIHAIVGF